LKLEATMPSDTSRETQVERRRERAREEIKKVVNRGNHPLFSLFEVTSISGRTYHVEIRSLDELQNSCTCPDYRTNLIGTCKHIEGVLTYLREAYGERLTDLACQRPSGTQVYLHYETEVTIRVGLPLPRRSNVRDLLLRHFDPTGVLIGAPLHTLPRLLADLDQLSLRDRSLVRVDQAVQEHLALLQDREAVAQQKAWFLDQVQRGQRTFDVLSTKLYSYQHEGALHLVFGRRALLADDMGLGKTIQAIAAAALLKDLRGIERALIVCPASLKQQWAREIKRFTALPVTVVDGGLAARREAYQAPSFFKIINYEIVRRDLADLQQLRSDLIILDEAQRIKNWRAKTADMVKQLRSRYAFVLTGTPLENRLDELYSIFQFLDPRILGPLWKFNERFFDVEERDNGTYKVLGYRNLDELRQTIGPYVLRRTRDEVLRDLPDRVDNNFFVEMTDPQWKAYEQFRETVAQLAAKAQRRPLTPKEREILLMSLIKMRLICNALALHDKQIPAKDREKTAPKLRELGEIMADQIAGNGHKAIVFSQWADMLAFTEPILKRTGLDYVKLTGDVPTAKRGALVERFFEDRNCRVFLSTDAGGVGLNLQAASLVVNLDLPWNPAVLEQRIGRAHRHGQSRSVHVINLIAKGTIEERMLDTLAAKRNVFAGVFGADEAPNAIKFEDSGQGLLKQINELLNVPVEVELELKPAKVEPSAPIEVIAPKPTLKGFAERLIAQLPQRVLLVRQAPIGDGILVVVDNAPGEVRSTIETELAAYFDPDRPVLHLMEQEGYRALLAFLPPTAAVEADAYRAAALPAPSEPDRSAERREKARQGLAFASKRVALAEVVLKGGFPEEMVRPLRESLGWSLSSLLALYRDRDPAADLPTPRTIQAELVEPKHLPDDLALRLARVRELTDPPGEGETLTPLSSDTGHTLLADVQALIELAQQRVVESGL
jgi:superfamily II DNA or RNA helicase